MAASAHRRRPPYLAAALGVLGALAGPAHSPGQPVASAATTLTHLTYGHGAAWTDYLQERAKAFQARTGIAVNVIAVADDPRGRYLAMHAGGVAPDVTDFWPELAGDLISKHYFLNLEPLARRANYDLSRLYQPQTLQALSFEGSLFGMPIYINPRVTHFNADLFANAGLLSPLQLGENWTWEAFREAAKKLTRDVNGDGTNDQFGVAGVTGYNWWQFIHQAGGSLYDRIFAPSRSQLNTEPVRTATQFAYTLLREDRVVGGSFTNGTAAMEAGAGPQLLWQLSAAKFNWDVALHPKGPYSRAAMFGIGGLEITATSKQQEAAWKWVEFLALNPESVRAYVRINQRIPPLRSIQPEFPSLVPQLPRNWQAYFDTVAQPNSFTLPVVTKNTDAVNSAINATMQRIWSGQLAIASGLEQLHEQVNALLR